MLQDRPSFLERRSVRPSTEANYQARAAEFEAWALGARLPTATAAELDEALLVWMHERFFDGAAADEGNTLLAALTYLRTDLSRGAPELPRARRAAAGWRKMAPSRSRLPLPWEVAALIAEEMLLRRRPVEAAATLVCFAFYLRPSEVLRLRRVDLVPPVAGASPALCPWTLGLNPQEGYISSETGESAKKGGHTAQLLGLLQPAARQQCRRTATSLKQTLVRC